MGLLLAAPETGGPRIVNLMADLRSSSETTGLHLCFHHQGEDSVHPSCGTSQAVRQPSPEPSCDECGKFQHLVQNGMVVIHLGLESLGFGVLQGPCLLFSQPS